MKHALILGANGQIAQWLLMLLAVAMLSGLAFFIGVTLIEKRQARAVAGMVPHDAPAHSRGAVVYFSRSGNTGLAARHVAKRMGSALYPLQVPEYELGLGGLARSAFAANARRTDPEALPDITPRRLNLKPFDTVWLGSPIWAFVEHNRFDGQHVVLFNTFNSNLAADQIAAFKAKVMARGARSFKHRQVLRGRMTRQLTPEEMLGSIDSEWFA
ncbi:flavodoxin [Aquabacterium sp.]|uniref:flavodoxin n=1 Tax=Aquabacterium sp. TaxID=1872578 RepID=UPI003B72E16B